MIRLWLDYQDLTRIRIASTPSPTGATMLYAQALQQPGSRWRPHLTGPARLVLDLAPPGRWLPDFLTPYTRAPELAAELDIVASTPARRMRAELERARGPRPPSWPRHLATGDRETVRLLIPSVFVTGPRFLADDDGPATLAFPAAPLALRSPDSLANLLGRTRAAALQALTDGPLTTGALAARLGVSAAAASQHTKALREASLLTSHRSGKTVHHTLTPLGRQHLHG